MRRQRKQSEKNNTPESLSSISSESESDEHDEDDDDDHDSDERSPSINRSKRAQKQDVKRSQKSQTFLANNNNNNIQQSQQQQFSSASHSKRQPSINLSRRNNLFRRQTMILDTQFDPNAQPLQMRYQRSNSQESPRKVPQSQKPRMTLKEAALKITRVEPSQSTSATPAPVVTPTPLWDSFLSTAVRRIQTKSKTYNEGGTPGIVKGTTDARSNNQNNNSPQTQVPPHQKSIMNMETEEDFSLPFENTKSTILNKSHQSLFNRSKINIQPNISNTNLLNSTNAPNYNIDQNTPDFKYNSKRDTSSSQFYETQEFNTQFKHANMHEQVQYYPPPTEQITRESRILSNTLNSIQKFNPFKSAILRLSNQVGIESTPYFNLLASIVILHAFSLVVFVPFFVDYLNNSSYDSSSMFISYFISHNYTTETGTTLTIGFILSVIIQAAFILLIYEANKRSSIQEQVNHIQASSSRTFQLVFNSWNFRTQETRSVENGTLALSKKINRYLSFLKGKGEVLAASAQKPSSLRTVPRFQKIFLFLTINLLILAIPFLSLIITNEILKAKSSSASFTSYFVKASAISALAFISGFFVKTITQCDQTWQAQAKFNISTSPSLTQKWQTMISEIQLMNESKYWKVLASHLVQIGLYYYANHRTLLTQNSESTNSWGIAQIPFNDQKYNCPEEQLTYSLIAIMLAYTAVSIVWSYLPILKNIIVHRLCSDTSSTSITAGEFSSLDSTIPLLVINFTILALAPYIPFVFCLSPLLFLALFFHGYLQTKKLNLPSSQILTKNELSLIQQQLVFLMLFLLSLFIGTTLSLNYERKAFVNHVTGSVRQCGAFNSNESPLQALQGYFESHSITQSISEVVLFQPLLWTIFCFFGINYCLQRNSNLEWKYQINRQKGRVIEGNGLLSQQPRKQKKKNNKQSSEHFNSPQATSSRPTDSLSQTPPKVNSQVVTQKEVPAKPSLFQRVFNPSISRVSQQPSPSQTQSYFKA